VGNITKRQLIEMQADASREGAAGITKALGLVNTKAKRKTCPMVKPFRVEHCNGVDRQLVVTVPIKIVSEMNRREHWAAVSNRKRVQKNQVWVSLDQGSQGWAYPVTVTLHRIGPRLLDGDNLQSGFKAVRDAVAAWLDIDDADERIIWKYSQAKERAYGCSITIVGATTNQGIKQ
jgi:hypothetical protein